MPLPFTFKDIAEPATTARRESATLPFASSDLSTFNESSSIDPTAAPRLSFDSSQLNTRQTPTGFEAAFKPPKRTALDAFKQIREKPTAFLPFLNVLELKESADVMLAAKAIDKGTATPEQFDMVKKSLQREAGGATLGFKAVDIALRIPSFAVEFFTGSFLIKKGAQRLAKIGLKEGAKVASKNMAAKIGQFYAKDLAGDLATLTTKNIFQKGSRDILKRAAVQAAAEAPIRALLMPNRVLENQIRRMMPNTQLSQDELGNINVMVSTPGDDFWPALAKAYGDTAIETFTERTGEQVLLLGGLVQQPTSYFKRVVTDKLSKRMGAKFVTDAAALYNTSKGRLKRFGWNGILGELYEERVGDVLRSGLGLQPISEILPSFEQLSAEALAFAMNPMMLGGMAHDAVTGRSRDLWQTNVDAATQMLNLSGSIQSTEDIKDILDPAIQTMTQISADPVYSGLLKFMGPLARRFTVPRKQSLAGSIAATGIAMETQKIYESAEFVKRGSGAEAVKEAMLDRLGIFEVPDAAAKEKAEKAGAKPIRKDRDLILVAPESSFSQKGFKEFATRTGIASITSFKDRETLIVPSSDDLDGRIDMESIGSGGEQLENTKAMFGYVRSAPAIEQANTLKDLKKNGYDGDFAAVIPSAYLGTEQDFLDGGQSVDTTRPAFVPGETREEDQYLLWLGASNDPYSGRVFVSRHSAKLDTFEDVIEEKHGRSNIAAGKDSTVMGPEATNLSDWVLEESNRQAKGADKQKAAELNTISKLSPWERANKAYLYNILGHKAEAEGINAGFAHLGEYSGRVEISTFMSGVLTEQLANHLAAEGVVVESARTEATEAERQAIEREGEVTAEEVEEQADGLAFSLRQDMSQPENVERVREGVRNLSTALTGDPEATLSPALQELRTAEAPDEALIARVDLELAQIAETRLRPSQPPERVLGPSEGRVAPLSEQIPASPEALQRRGLVSPGQTVSPQFAESQREGLRELPVSIEERARELRRRRRLEPPASEEIAVGPVVPAQAQPGALSRLAKLVPERRSTEDPVWLSQIESIGNPSINSAIAAWRRGTTTAPNLSRAIIGNLTPEQLQILVRNVGQLGGQFNVTTDTIANVLTEDLLEPQEARSQIKRRGIGGIPERQRRAQAPVFPGRELEGEEVDVEALIPEDQPFPVREFGFEPAPFPEQASRPEPGTFRVPGGRLPELAGVSTDPAFFEQIPSITQEQARELEQSMTSFFIDNPQQAETGPSTAEPLQITPVRVPSGNVIAVDLVGDLNVDPFRDVSFAASADLEGLTDRIVNQYDVNRETAVKWLEDLRQSDERGRFMFLEIDNVTEDIIANAATDKAKGAYRKFRDRSTGVEEDGGGPDQTRTFVAIRGNVRTVTPYRDIDIFAMELKEKDPKPLDNNKSVASQMRMVVPIGGTMAQQISEEVARSANNEFGTEISVDKGSTVYRIKTAEMDQIKAFDDNFHNKQAMAIRNNALDIDAMIVVTDTRELSEGVSLEREAGFPMGRLIEQSITGVYPQARVGFPRFSRAGERLPTSNEALRNLARVINENPTRRNYADGVPPVRAVLPIDSSQLIDGDTEALAKEIRDFMVKNGAKTLGIASFGNVDMAPLSYMLETFAPALEQALTEKETREAPPAADKYTFPITTADRDFTDFIGLKTAKGVAEAPPPAIVPQTTRVVALDRPVKPAGSRGSDALWQLVTNAAEVKDVFGDDVVADLFSQLTPEDKAILTKAARTPIQTERAYFKWANTDVVHTRVLDDIAPGVSPQLSFSLQQRTMTAIRNFNNNRSFSPEENRFYNDRVNRILAGDTRYLKWLYWQGMGRADRRDLFPEVAAASNANANRLKAEPTTTDQERVEVQGEFDVMSASLVQHDTFPIETVPLLAAGNQGLQRLLLNLNRESRAMVEQVAVDSQEWRDEVAGFEDGGVRVLEAIGARLDNPKEVYIIRRVIRGSDGKPVADPQTGRFLTDDPVSQVAGDRIDKISERWDAFAQANGKRSFEQLTNDIRTKIEERRVEANKFMKRIAPAEWIGAWRDYVKHIYSPSSLNRSLLETDLTAEERALRLVETAQAAQARNFKTYREAAEAKGWEPLTMDVSKLHNIWGRDVWKVAARKQFLNLAVNVQGIDGDLEVIAVPRQDFEGGKEIIESNALRSMAEKLADQVDEKLDRSEPLDKEIRRLVEKLEPIFEKRRATIAKIRAEQKAPLEEIQKERIRDELLDYDTIPSPFNSISEFRVKKGRAANLVKHVVDGPTRHGALQWAEHINAWSKYAALSFSAFHPFALLESGIAAQGIKGDWLRRLVKMPKALRDYRKDILEDKNRLDPWIRSGLMVGIINPDVQTSLIDAGIDRAIQNSDQRWYGFAKKNLQQFQKFKQRWDNFLWTNVHPTLKLFTAESAFDRLKENYRLTDRPFNEDLMREQISRYVNDAFGGQEWEQYTWATPKMRQLLHLVLFAPDWTMSAANVAGFTQSLPGFEALRAPMSLAERDEIFRIYWPAMVGLVLFGIPSALQTMIYMMFGDPEEGDKPMMIQNEIGKRSHVDLTPMLRKMGWVPLVGYEGGDTGARRVYLRWGKQAYEVFEGWLTKPNQTFMNKTSVAIKTAYEQLTGLNTAGWELPFKGEGPLGLIVADGSIFKSRASFVAQKFLPLSILTALQGRPTSFFAPSSRGTSIRQTTEEMARILEAYADPATWRVVSGNAKMRENLIGLMPETVEAAIRNGINPQEAFNRAKAQVRGKYYKQFFRAQNAKNQGKMDQAAKSLNRLGAGEKQIIQSMKRRAKSTLDRVVGEEQIRQIQEATAQ